jgi:hypothetical protein
VLRQVHAVVAVVFVGAIVVQVFLAGLAIPQLGGNGNFDTHRGFGYLIGLITLVLVITAAVAQMGRRRILQSLGFLGLYVVQSSLPFMDESGLPVAAALHPVMALVMFGLGAVYLRQVWRERNVAAA